jgi:hypothetical protein
MRFGDVPARCRWPCTACGGTPTSWRLGRAWTGAPPPTIRTAVGCRIRGVRQWAFTLVLRLPQPTQTHHYHTSTYLHNGRHDDMQWANDTRAGSSSGHCATLGEGGVDSHQGNHAAAAGAGNTAHGGRHPLHDTGDGNSAGLCSWSARKNGETKIGSTEKGKCSRRRRGMDGAQQGLSKPLLDPDAGDRAFTHAQ